MGHPTAGLLVEIFSVGILNKEEGTMSGKIDPEAATPTTVQSFDLSDRNPAVTSWGGTGAEGGLIPSPAEGEQRVTRPGPAVSPDAGLKY
jgi:hypothetical protein